MKRTTFDSLVLATLEQILELVCRLIACEEVVPKKDYRIGQDIKSFLGGALGRHDMLHL